tara:strand:+ start:4146 stop:4331 length:186 start_codon:yes stop_codon:yes gene_type:complete
LFLYWVVIEWFNWLNLMVGLVRMDFYRNGILNVVHLPTDEARQEHKRRTEEGWVLAFSVPV